MQQSDLSTLSTPHLMTLCVYWCVYTHCPVACGDIRHCRTCCCRGQGNNGWLLLSCHLLSANALYSIYNLHNSINTASHHTSLGGPVCAEPVYHLHYYIAVIIMATSHISCHVQCGHHGSWLKCDSSLSMELEQIVARWCSVECDSRSQVWRVPWCGHDDVTLLSRLKRVPHYPDKCVTSQHLWCS